MSQLLPEGIDRLDDVPYTYWNALRVALGFLRFDELEKEERPPRRIWLEHDEMRAHWTAVKRRREEKYGTGGGDAEGEPVVNRRKDAMKELFG